MRRQNNNGNILMSILLLVLVTFLGLGLLNVSILHTRIRGARNYKNTAVERMGQELIYHLHQFREKVMDTNIRDLPHPETDFFNRTRFPDTTGICDDRISITNSFSYVDFPDGGFTRFRVTDRIHVSSANNNYGINSEVFIDMACGRIPLLFFPFFLNKEIDKPEEIYMEENRVFDNGGGNPVVSDIGVDMDTTGYLMECLGIQGDALTWALIRQKFGFELTDEPLPDGIHLLIEGGVLRCIFIQGDVDRLLFSTEGDIQKIVFIRGYASHEYHYKPGENYFLYWDDLRSEEMLYAENILVNGNIWSLEQEGEAAFTSNSNITLFATGEIVIRTNLKADDDGASSNVVRSTHLTLLSCFEKLFGQEGKTPGITVDTIDAVDGGTVQVSIVTDGKVINRNPKLKVEGSIFGKELENGGLLEIDYLDSNSACRNFFRTREFNYIYHFHINSIEEEEV
jgi:hypothetical protein